ncbi:MAG: hypothetical protein C4336_05260 [Armatimonadota bacterium]
MRLTVAWEESLPTNTLSFDTLIVPMKHNGSDQPRPTPLLVTIDDRFLRFWLWQGNRFEPVRQHPHRLQRDLYCLSNAPNARRMLYTDGASWQWTEKTLAQDIPTRQVPIGRMTDAGGVERMVCFDGETNRPFYYVLEKPLSDDEFFIEPEDIYADKAIQSLVMRLPRLAESFQSFYTNGYRFLCRYRAHEKETARVYGIAVDRIALIELRENRRLDTAWRTDLRRIGSLRREMPLVVRTGDPKDEKRNLLLVMRATPTQVQLIAYHTT